MTSTLKLLTVFAHPDDESMGMGGTLAKYASEGVETYLLCASRGEKGWFGAAERDPGPVRLGQIRESELRCAGERLGLREVHFLGYVDGEVDQADPPGIIRKIVTHLRRIRPQVVVTFPPDGNYGHPDHIAIGQFTSSAIVCAADASYADEAGLPALRVDKLYYMVDSDNFVNLITPFLGEITIPVDGQLRGEVPWREWAVTTRIEMAPHCLTAWGAIQCHQSQLPTLGPLRSVPEDTAVSILARQGTFYRAYSLVNGGRRLETDLFEGLR
jgi:LmbE family N-acetylglucosaminyl deacetylase